MQLKIASINFWGQPWPASLQKKARLVRLAEFIKAQDFDIVCIQELWLVKDIGKLLGMVQGYFSYCESKVKMNPSGLVILSKFPLMDNIYVRFGVIDYEEVVYKKGMLISKIRFSNGRFLRIINTHFYATIWPLRSKIWTKQLTQLYSAFNEIPTLVFGDFNYDYKKFPFPDLNLLSSDAFATRNTENIYNKKSFNRFSKINMTCDLIFSTFDAKVLSSSIVRDKLISDHYPVISVIEI